MRQKIILIFLTAFSTQMIIACCDCPETKTYQYKFEYVAAFNLDNSGANPIISESPISKSAYGIKLQIGMRQLSLQDHTHFSLFSQAHAFRCGCEPGTTITPRDSITTLKITTINKLSNEHPEGSDVSNLFKVLRSGMYVDIDSVITRPDIYFTTTDTKHLELFLLTPPERAGRYSFKIDLILSNGSQISDSTKIIDLE